MNNRQRVSRTHAVILRRRLQGDADRILTVFTPNDGKMDLIAKGARKTSSRKAGHLELYMHASLLVAEASTWGIITEVVTVQSFRHMRDSLEHIGRATYICELVDRFSEVADENQPLWDLLLLALSELNAHAKEPTSFDLQLLMRWFELHLLSVTGFQPQLFYCMGSGDELRAETNYLSIVEGGVFGPKAGANREDIEAIEPDVLKILRYLQSRRWSEVRNLSVKPVTMQHVENILYRLLLSILERHLKSIDFLRKLKATQRQRA